MSEALGIAPSGGAPAPAPLVGEPTIESLAALVPDPVPAATPGAERGDIPAPPMQDKATADEKEEPAKAKVKEEADPEEAEEPAEAAADKAALERAEAAAKRAREGSRRYREMLENQRRVQFEAERLAREAEENRRQAIEAQRFQEELKKDPYASLKRLGMTDQELAERALREGTPEHEMRTLLQQQQEALAAERQRLQALEQRIENERQATLRQQAEAKFHSIADNESSYPRLSLLAPTAQLAVAEAALKQIASNGYDVRGLSDDQVAEACERFLAPKRAAKAVSAPASAKPAPAAAPAPKANTSLTNAVSNTRATAPRPWEDLSDDEQIAAIAASLPDAT